MGAGNQLLTRQGCVVRDTDLCSIHIAHLLNQETLLPANQTLQKQHQHPLGHDSAVHTEAESMGAWNQLLPRQGCVVKGTDLCSIHIGHLLNQDTLLPATQTFQKQHQHLLGHDSAVETELSPL